MSNKPLDKKGKELLHGIITRDNSNTREKLLISQKYYNENPKAARQLLGINGYREVVNGNEIDWIKDKTVMTETLDSIDAENKDKS